jgi:hypothetical protein
MTRQFALVATRHRRKILAPRPTRRHQNASIPWFSTIIITT